MKTFVPKDVERKWWLVDADGKVLGRLATQVAVLLRGKHKPQFADFVDTGDFVVVVNADKVTMTGAKWPKKTYYRHSGYLGGLKETTAAKLFQKRPEEVLRFAVKGMLPKTSLGRRQLKKLKIYTGPEHPHQAQKPETLEI